MSAAIRNPIMRFHGGKYRLYRWLQHHLPPHLGYVEPFGGAASVLLQKPPASVEVYNDLDGNVVNVFRVMRDPLRARELERRLRLTPFARQEFEEAYLPTDDPVECARRTIVRAQMGFGTAGATKGRSGFRGGTTRRSHSVSADWNNYVGRGLAHYTERLRKVVIESRPAVDLFPYYDRPDTLWFVDPPYLPETRCRSAGKHASGRYYVHEMTHQQHVYLLESVRGLDGMVIVCGYDSELYHDTLAGWHVQKHSSVANGHRGGVMRTEVIWCNNAAAAGRQQQQFEFSQTEVVA